MTMILVSKEMAKVFKQFSYEIGCSDDQVVIKDIQGFKSIASYDENDNRLCAFVKMLYDIDEAS